MNHTMLWKFFIFYFLMKTKHWKLVGVKTKVWYWVTLFPQKDGRIGVLPNKTYD